MKPLTKSRFKLGLECPNKLYYTDKPEYANQKEEDPFLAMLAQGGFQVEALARLQYPGGQIPEADFWDHEALWEKTKELLQQEHVTLYEAGFLVDDLFARTDILVKEEQQVDLIEVKAKSYNKEEDSFLTNNGTIRSGWESYLFDVAFQKYVVQKCFPDWEITAHLLMADKQKTASVEGMNQHFRLYHDNDDWKIDKQVSRLEEVGDTVLTTVNIDDIADDIIGDELAYPNDLVFSEAVSRMRKHYLNDTYPGWPTLYSACKYCEFYTTPEDEEDKRSGFKECFKRKHNWTEEEFKKPLIFDIWDFKDSKVFDEKQKAFMEELEPEDVGTKEKHDKLSRNERQWLQVQKAIKGDDSEYVMKDRLKETIESWEYPLHFIDFETSMAALPFHKGMRPYEWVTFQFSHHIYREDGSIEHANQFIDLTPGQFPNFTFIRELKKALEAEKGTIFQYSKYENSVLNQINDQLEESEEAGKDELIKFIHHITYLTDDNQNLLREGARNMVDLCAVIKDFYYNPLTEGSNSIKDVFPAVLKKSQKLQEKYNEPIGEINVTSQNFTNDKIWLQIEEGEPMDPYDTLPSLYQGWTDKEIKETLSGLENISEGSAAMMAYDKCQYTNMSDKERKELRQALFKYCELDTLAMVMVFEHLKSIL